MTMSKSEEKQTAPVKTEEKTITALEFLLTGIEETINEGLMLPEGYDSKSAVQSAYLKLMELKDKNDKGVFEVCTRGSILNAVRVMVISGLYPDKTQGYFIIRGNQLTFMPSYFGMQMMIKRDAGVKDVFAQVVLIGDELQTEIRHGEEYVVEGSHKRKRVWDGKTATMTRDTIAGVYAIVVMNDGSERHQIMDKEQIEKAWAQTSSKGQNVHNNFAEQMSQRSVINRIGKKLLNTSPDRHLQMVGQALNEAFPDDDNNDIFTPPEVAYKVGVSPDDDEVIQEGKFEEKASEKEVEGTEAKSEVISEVPAEEKTEPEQLKAPF